MFKVGERYQASYITNDEFYGIYDQLIALVDGELVHLTDWHADLMDEIIQERKEEGIEATEDDVYDEAFEDVCNDIPVAYEDAKEIFVFRGIAPHGGFDVFINYECVKDNV